MGALDRFFGTEYTPVDPAEVARHYRAEAMKTVLDLHGTDNPLERGACNKLKFKLEKCSDADFEKFTRALVELGLHATKEHSFFKGTDIISIPAHDGDLFLQMQYRYDHEHHLEA